MVKSAESWPVIMRLTGNSAKIENVGKFGRWGGGGSSKRINYFRKVGHRKNPG